jgi:sialate O-acetylesterase
VRSNVLTGRLKESFMKKTSTSIVGWLVASLMIGAALALFLSVNAHADVRMPAIFSDNMVLQQGQPVPVWGWADEGEEVTVMCQGQRVSTQAKGGKWMVKLKPLKAADASAPETLTIDGKNRIRFQNVLIGEVWIASGQSNMEWPLNRAFEPQADIATATNANIRLYTVEKTKASEPLADQRVRNSWLECKPVNATWFSAVGYYFARALQQARKVPVGIIHTSWGGSPAEVWMSRDVLEANPSYRADILEKSAAQLKSFQEQLAAWEKETAELKKEGKRQTKQRPREPWVPCQLYNGMIAPLVPYAVKGAIWYQGESNAGRAWQYRTLMQDLIKNWRQVWGQQEFTFLQVQLAPFIPGQQPKPTEPGESAWAELREAQLLATKQLPMVGIAVITDVGEERDIHPKKKAPVGERLALAARGIAYKERGLVYSGPIYKSMKIKKDQVYLSFDHVGDGLEARDGELKGFAICGADRKWVWAKATIGTGKDANQVIVSSPNIPNPVAVRYGWADYPEVNLWNKNGLPASPFRTDDFPLITMPKQAAATK